ncbi:glycosyltransferase [Streptomyces sp. NPDC059506]|uniref:glycosyltransferase n=1 Tax=Streptomyces TaxID=1883 RepID=UPI001C70E862|nr:MULTISPECIES: glycosyltransferase [unclassified Streptomyces]MCZ2526315.1 glycosyltransferase [Streptomyces sp. HB2AG]
MIFSIVPLAQAARAAGHEVFMAGPEDVMPIITRAGLPGVPVTSTSMMDTLRDKDGNRIPIPTDLHERFLFNGRCFGRFAAACLEGLIPLADRWRPDLVVGGALAFAAPLIAAYAGVPYVKHAVDMGEPRTIDLAAASELGFSLERLGLYDMPRFDLFVDTCPPSLRVWDAPPAQPMRYVPYTTPKAVEPWMYTKGERPRVMVTAGSRITPDYYFDVLAALVQKVQDLDVELLVGAPDDMAAELGPLPENVRAGWLPLDVIAPTCDVVVNHAGGNTVLGSMAHGVPQVLIPYLPYVVDYSERLTEYGAATLIRPGEDSAEAIAAAVDKVLGNPSYRERAHDIAEEMRRMPAPTDVVRALEELREQGRREPAAPPRT